MDAAGFGTAHVAGNSLGGFVALQLAARGRARSVIALAPAGGWAPGDASEAAMHAHHRVMHDLVRAAAPHAGAIAATADGRRQATQMVSERSGHLPPDLVAHLIRGAAACTDLPRLVDHAERAGWALDAQDVACPVRIVWGTADRILPLPGAAVRFRRDWLPHAEWVELDGAGHCPQLDVPLETAELIVGFTAP